ncbi:MAG: toxin-antitoxin system HicB family antitoxin [Anaerovoracaceae bacterium]
MHYLWRICRKCSSKCAGCKKTWLEAAIEEGIAIHEPDSLEAYSGQFKLRIPRSLHRLLAEHSQREGISMNQYCVYLLSRNDAVYTK